ncbi:Tyr recombinase domain-containing protein [Durusdinium trenchii]|uniref:Tyr recombinase domain-containing protein n=1 Tax=Durusdinium trenchii TaxID=1381693 RepID=A0ABP0MIL1_9DINO
MGGVRLVLVAALTSAQGWWWNETMEPPPTNSSPPGRWEALFRETMPTMAAWWDDGGVKLTGVRQWTVELGDGGNDRDLWMVFDLIFSLVGWALFGSAWSGVKVGCKRALQLALVLILCIVAHYVWALCWPVLSLILTIGMALVWLVRKTVKILGNMAYRGQRLLGGTPEAGDADFVGPGMGRTPETAELRGFKPNSTEKWIVLKRDEMTVVFKLGGDTFPIRSSGLYASIEPDTLRGHPRLLALLRGHDKVHLCRHGSCGEDGQHFQIYALAKKFDPEKFQLQQACQSAKDAGSFLWGVASTTTRRLADFGSESEPEAEKCEAHRVRWTGQDGEERLSVQVCGNLGTREAELLEEDKAEGKLSVPLCAQHTTQYLLTRYTNKCAFGGCSRLGTTSRKGVRYCTDHEEEAKPSRQSRSRSRERPRDPDPPELHPGDDRPEERRERGQNELGEMRELLKEIKGSLETAQGSMISPPSVTHQRKRGLSKSPGRTPKSSIHRNLAKIGMLDSPDDVHMGNLLEEFFDMYAETRGTNVGEGEIRSRLAERHDKEVAEVTRTLVQLALVEQDKGQKGLSKFIKSWSKAYDHPEIAEFPSSATQSDWSVVSSTRTSPAKEVTPMVVERSAQPVLIEKPGIFGQDRKAGAGGAAEGDPMLQASGDQEFGLVRRHSSLASLAAAGGEQDHHEELYSDQDFTDLDPGLAVDYQGNEDNQGEFEEESIGDVEDESEAEEMSEGPSRSGTEEQGAGDEDATPGETMEGTHPGPEGVWANPEQAHLRRAGAGAMAAAQQVGFVQDQWEVSIQQGQMTIYHHVPRTEFFVPGGVGFPCDVETLRNERSTRCMGTYADGQTFSIEWMDNWRIEGPANPELPPWTGYTVFTLQGRSLDGVDHPAEMEGTSSSEGTEVGDEELEDLDGGQTDEQQPGGGTTLKLSEPLEEAPQVLEVSPKDREVRDFEAVALTSGAVVDPESEAAFTIVAATMGVDAKGQLAERVRQCGMMADLILLEGPLVSSWEVFNNAELFDQWGKWEMEFVTTELGEATARRRRMMIMMKGAEDACLQVVEDYLIKTPVASSMASCIKPAGAEGLTWEFPMRLQICPGIPRDPLLPALVAHGWWAEESERVNIYGLGGPARWPLMDKTNGQMERIFVYDLKGPVGAVRALTPWELWRCQGRDSTSWAQARDNGVGEEDLLRQGCRGTGRRTAQSLLFAAAKVVTEHVREQSADEGRAGAVRDGPEDESLAKLLLWLRKWRTGEFGRGLISRRAGGVGAETLAGMKENAQVVWRWGESLWLEALEELEEFAGRSASWRASKLKEGGAMFGQQPPR